ncbi:hypothetical protein [Dyella japonica]|uniref:hypothetical protein n=1 Tax=Dyella japonica TaxID=231455 RepID=UPI00069A819E|nr:hypothetical protein [Dyella japonica]
MTEPQLPPSERQPLAFQDTFRGDHAQLLRSIRALLALDADNALAPHGIGGHARSLLHSAGSRLEHITALAKPPFAFSTADLQGIDLGKPDGVVMLKREPEPAIGFDMGRDGDESATVVGEFNANGELHIHEWHTGTLAAAVATFWRAHGRQQRQSGRRYGATSAGVAAVLAYAATLKPVPASDKLWALHMLGPDDVIAAPSKLAADAVAKNFNAYWDEQRHTRDHDVRVVATVIEWPFEANRHAKAVMEDFGEYVDLLEPASASKENAHG